MTGGASPDEQHRRSTVEERLTVIERDVRDHAKSLTALVASGSSFSSEQVEQLRTVLREELGDAGLRLDGPDHVDASREDFRFLRRLRLNWDGASRRVGGIVLVAVLGIAMAIIGAGFWAWLGKGLGR